MVEHAAVNRGVAGSSPARGAEKTVVDLLSFFYRKCGRLKLLLISNLFSAIIDKLKRK